MNTVTKALLLLTILMTQACATSPHMTRRAREYFNERDNTYYGPQSPFTRAQSRR
jgi:hypothetical protein